MKTLSKQARKNISIAMKKHHAERRRKKRMEINKILNDKTLLKLQQNTKKYKYELYIEYDTPTESMKILCNGAKRAVDMVLDSGIVITKFDLVRLS